MENINIDSYKLAWKNEKKFQDKNLSDSDIHNFMKSASKTLGQYKRALLLDIVLKIILLFVFVLLILILQYQRVTFYTNLFFILLTLLGLLWQLKVYKKMSKINLAEQNLKNNISIHIDFYSQHYIKSIFVTALSSTLLFLGGSLFYLYLKYHQIPSFEFDDYLVLCIGIVLSYGLSAFIQFKQHTYQIEQLKSCLKEIEENSLNEDGINKYNHNMLINTIVFGFALIIGLILFLFLIFRINF